MKKLLVFLVSVSLLSNVSFGLGKAGNEYYKQISLDGDFSFVGKYPVEESNAKTGRAYKFSYNKNGRLEKIEHLTNGVIKENDLYFGVATIVITYEEDLEKREYFNYRGKPEQDVVSGVYGVKIRRNMDQNTVSLFNYNKGGQLVQDRYDVAHYLCYLNDEGRRVRSIRFDEQGERIIDTEGYCDLRTVYDENGNVKEQVNYNISGDEMDSEIYITSVKRQYNDNGDVIVESYYGIDDALKLHSRLGVAMVKRAYDDNGNIVEESYYGIDEELMERNEFNGYSYATIRYKYADSGELKKIVYLDIHNREI